MKIQRINDERLALKNLQNIRLVYVLQTLGIIGLLAYDFIVSGIDAIKENPSLLIIFILSTIILAFLSMKGDERLVFKNLQIVRIAYAIQTLGIVGVLTYDFVSKGIDGMTEIPLWIMFIVATSILAFLSMNVSVDYKKNKYSPKKELFITLIVLTLICIVTGIFVSLNEEYTIINGLLSGGIFLICGSIPFLYLYHLSKKIKAEV